MKPLIFRLHALQRMAQRDFDVEDVCAALQSGQIIEEYKDDFPYASMLILGWVGERPIHIVVASSPTEQIIITVYEPDPLRWTSDFTKRTT